MALYARRRGSYAGAEVIHMLSGSAIFLSQRAMIAVHGRPAVFAAHRAVFDLIASATTPGLGEAWKAVNTRRLNTTS